MHPCEKLTAFNAAYRAHYEHPFLQNAERMKREGIAALVRGQRASWRCDCGVICIHGSRCSGRGKPGFCPRG